MARSKEEKKAWFRSYYQRNKERLKLKSKEWRKENPYSGRMVDNRVKSVSMCANCNYEYRRFKSNGGPYCSAECANEKRYLNKRDAWLSGNGISPTTAWVRKVLCEMYGRKCSMCGLSEWLGDPICIEVDHIDGNGFNQVPSNVRLLCPNCHARTPTYKNKNRGNGRKARVARGEALVY